MIPAPSAAPVDDSSEGRRLIVVYGPGAFSPIQLFTAAVDLCRLVWVIDGADIGLAGLLRQLNRLGDVVDTAGSTTDELLGRLRELGPSGITTFDDDHLALTAHLAGRLDLPFHSPATVATLTDKYLQRQRLSDAGLPTPRYRLIEDGSDATAWRRAAEAVGFPAVLKPAHGSASRHTYRVTESSQLVARASGAEVAEAAGGFVLEQYLPDLVAAPAREFADFVSVETVMGGDQRLHLAITGKLPLAEDFREGGHFVPSQLSEPQRAAVLEATDAALSALGMTVGAAHTEVKLTPDGPRIIEVNGRVGGAVPDVLQIAGGPDLLRQAMRAALGRRPEDRTANSYERIGFQINVQPPKEAHRVIAIEGFDALDELPGILQVENRHPPGSEVDWQKGTEELVLRVLGVADDLEGFRHVRRRMGDVVRITYQ